MTDKCSHSALDYSYQYGHNEILCLLLKQSEMQLLLLENGANPHVKDHNNCDALYWAQMGYDDGAGSMRCRNPPDIVVNIIQILREYESN
ncbi:unnamed protein product [Rotaria sordida]|uniref:Uncharacterized protein n=1 Tax=Rotaria sordida TaxID=392033 RepID=A0A814S804_9BILA|nr:unnamed protein product [Rotaria sordida]CAF1155896.1 unnamed protein product [Rotaria sordida]CAF1175843.1 unnamed protein product [Rotaria sordida]CAF3580465.1 unnamed protein product [Rotaria sordida]CAF3648332.1 unnamed protein product [Rotaria sordida]